MTAPHWTQSHPDPHWVYDPPGLEIDAPGELRFYSAAFDQTNGRTVIFGGSNMLAVNVGKTWTWDGTVWTDITPGTSPAAQQKAAMAWHNGTGKIVLFTNDGNGETWTLDDVTWTQETPATSPADGYTTFNPGQMCYDAVNDKVVMFGGSGDGVPVDNTYTWDGADWTLEAPGTSPPASTYDATALAWDANNLNVVLFGTGSTYSNETWIWDGSDWSDAAPGSPPPVRLRTGMAYHGGLGSVILFGGEGAILYGDTWKWDGSAWTDLGINPPFDFRLDALPRAVPLVSDSFQNLVVIYGGDSALSSVVAYADTWQLVGSGGGGGGGSPTDQSGSLVIGAQGVASKMPDATDVPDNFVWYSTDIEAYYVASGGSWVLLTVSGGVSGPILGVGSNDASVTVTGGTGPVADLAVNFPAVVETLAKSGDTPLTGAVTLSEGTGITLTEVGQDIEIAATGGTSLDQQGSGSPVGAVTPTGIGYRYTDTANGAVYVALGATDTDWVELGGPADATVAGARTDGASSELLANAGLAALTDVASKAGTGNGAFWDAQDGDGSQYFRVKLGPASEFEWTFSPDGSLKGFASSVLFFSVAPDGDIHIPVGANVVADL